MILNLDYRSLLFTIIILYGCSSVPKSYKEKTLDDMYPILTDEQYQIVESLDSDKKIDLFLEEVWQKIDSASGLKENELKDVYLKRLAYANVHFPDRRGWGRSDRKRIYLINGPPAYIDRQEFTSYQLGKHSNAKSVEIWLYMTPGKNTAFPSRGDDIYYGEKKYIFGDMTGSGFYQFLYSSEDKNDIDVRLYKNK